MIRKKEILFTFDSPCVDCKKYMSKEWLDQNCSEFCVRWLMFNKRQKRKMQC